MLWRGIIDMNKDNYLQQKFTKEQLTQLSWRPLSLIKSREEMAYEMRDHIQPQNFKLSDMLMAQAEEIRILLRQCGIPEPEKPKSFVVSKRDHI